MPQSMPELPACFTEKTGFQAGRESGVVSPMGRAMEKVETVAMRCLKAAGNAFVEGLVAYASSMHGLPNPLQLDAWRVDTASGGGTDGSAEIMTPHYQEIDELIAWLEAQSDRARDRLGVTNG